MFITSSFSHDRWLKKLSKKDTSANFNKMADKSEARTCYRKRGCQVLNSYETHYRFH